jgi:hypothetical protein
MATFTEAEVEQVRFRHPQSGASVTGPTRHPRSSGNLRWYDLNSHVEQILRIGLVSGLAFALRRFVAPRFSGSTGAASCGCRAVIDKRQSSSLAARRSGT